MSDDITHDLDLLDDWLAGKGYGEEAGLVLRALSLIHKLQDGVRSTIQERDVLSGENFDLRAENEKLRAAGLELVSQTIAAQQAEIEKLRAILFQFAAYDDGYESADCGAMTVITVPIGVIRAAAAALKETGDE